MRETAVLHPHIRSSLRVTVLLATLIFGAFPGWGEAVAQVADAPDTQITGGPEGPTNETDPTFTYVVSGATGPATFECRLTQSGQASPAFTACANTGSSYSVANGVSYTFEVRATDLTGPDATPASRSFSVDTDPPITTITGGPDGPTADSTPTFTYSSNEAGSTFECSVDNVAEAAFSGCPEQGLELPPQDPGPHTFYVRAIDPATNKDATPAARNFTVDTDAPETTVTGGPSGLTGDDTPSFTYSSDEAGSTFQCAVDGTDEESFASCSDSGTTLGQQSDGAHTFYVRAIDPAGNVDATPASRAFTVDTDPPQTVIVMGSPHPTSDNTPSFTYESDEASSTFECRLDDGVDPAEAFASCPVTGKDYTAVADGTYIFEVRATDPAGNTDPTPDSLVFTVDTDPPETTILTGPQGSTIDDTPAFTYESDEDSSSFECRLTAGSVGSGAFTGCPASGKTYDPLADGEYIFEVKAVDLAGNADPSPDSRTFTISTEPETTITGGPSGPTNDNTPTFTFVSDEPGSTFRCRIVGSSYESCPGGTKTFDSPPLADGSYTFQVFATDPDGDPDFTPATRDFTVDTDPPDTDILTGPSGPTNDDTPSFTYSSDEPGSSFECRLDDGVDPAEAFAPCPVDGKTYDSLTDGVYTFEVRAIDAATNTDDTPASLTFTVDTAPPDTVLATSPPDPTNDPTADFTFSSVGGGVSFACRVTAQGATPDDYAPCTSPFTTAVLTDGVYTFEVRAIDAAGNADPSPDSKIFTVDTDPPDTVIATSPPDPTSDPTADFTFSSVGGGVSFACRVTAQGDTPGSFADCVSPFSTPPLTDGTYTFEVRATDAAGNADPSPDSSTFTVDTDPPDTDILTGPSGPTNDGTPSFTYSSDEIGSSFECRLDDGVDPAEAFAPCPVDGKDYDPLTDGAYTFEVRAIDAATNTDDTPASRAITVDTGLPDTTIDGGTPAGSTQVRDHTFTYSSDEPGTTFECRLAGGAPPADAFGNCSETGKVYTNLPDGTYTFEVRATDAADNTDASPASRMFTVDNDAPETTITGGPSGVTSDNTPSFTYSSDEPGSFECRLGSAAFADCPVPGTTLGPLADGTYTFEVRATDAATNVDASPASRTFTVNTLDARCGSPGVICGTNASEVLIGSSGNDTIIGGGGDDLCRGLGGNDLIICGEGDDIIEGGSGNDTLISTGGNDLIYGQSGRDRLIGGAGNDRLSGGRGRDRLIGGGGRDRLNGGPGRDSCIGGPGRDRFRRCEKRR